MKKVFVGGSKNLKVLPPKAISYLNDLANEGTRFLVGDCAGTDTLVQTFLRERGAKKVRVYTAEDSPRNNLGAWKVTGVKRRRAKIWPFLRQKDKDFAMAEDADCAFMVWDGKSKGTFSNILGMLHLKKPVSVFILETSELLVPASYEDLETYVKPTENPYLDETLRRELLREFMPSELMREHLQTAALSKEQVRDLICFFPVSIYKKQKWLKLLAKRENLLHEMLMRFRDNSDPEKCADTLLAEVCNASFAERAWEIGQAVDALTLRAGEVFYLRVMYYDTQCGVCEGTENSALFRSLDAVLNKIDFAVFVEEMETPPGEDVLLWFVLEKWVPDDGGRMKKIYKYFFLGKDPCFVEITDVGRTVNDSALHISTKHFLMSNSFGWKFHLPTPLEVGDILLIDQRPARPPVKAIVLDGNGEDNHAVRVGRFDSDGKWTVESLCSFFFPGGYYKPWEQFCNSLHIFPLYYLKKIDPSQYGDDGEVAELIRMWESDPQEYSQKH